MSFESKYAPNRISEVVFAEQDIANTILDYRTGRQTKSLLLHGPYGTGKTTLAKLLPCEVEDQVRGTQKDESLFEIKSADVKFISGGAKNRVDGALKSLQEQLRVMSINPSGRHYVIIDEVDCLSQDKFQPALKSFMTENAHAMFILTTNHLDRVDCGIKSRCKVLHIAPPSALQWMPRIYSILRQEGVSLDRDMLLKLLQDHESDGRKILEKLEDLVAQVRRQSASFVN